MHTYYETTYVPHGSSSSVTESDLLSVYKTWGSDSASQASGTFLNELHSVLGTSVVAPYASTTTNHQTISRYDQTNETLTASFTEFTDVTSEITADPGARTSYATFSTGMEGVGTSTWTTSSTETFSVVTVTFQSTSHSTSYGTTGSTSESHSTLTTGYTGTASAGVASTGTTATTSYVYTTTDTTISRSQRTTSGYTELTQVGQTFNTIYEPEPNEHAFLLTGTAYTAGYPTQVAASFTKTTLSAASKSFVLSQEAATSTDNFVFAGLRTTTSTFNYNSTYSDTLQLSRYSANGAWPMTATSLETLTLVLSTSSQVTVTTTVAASVTLTGSFSACTPVAFTVTATIQSTQALVCATMGHPSSSANYTFTGLITTTATIDSQTTTRAATSTLGTSTYGTGTFNSWSTWVGGAGSTQHLSSTAVTTSSFSTTSDSAFSTTFVDGKSGTTNSYTEKRWSYTTTEIADATYSTTTSAVDVTESSVIGYSTSYSEDSHVDVSEVYTSSNSTSLSSTTTCVVAPSTETASGSTVDATSTRETYGTTVHDAQVTVANSSELQSTAIVTGACTEAAGTESFTFSTENSTATSYETVSVSHGGIVTSAGSAATTRSDNSYTELCDVPSSVESESGVTTAYQDGTYTVLSITGRTISHGGPADVAAVTATAETFSTFTEACAIPESIEETFGSTTYNAGTSQLTSYTAQTIHHDAPNPHTVTWLTRLTSSTVSTTSSGTHTVSQETVISSTTASSSAAGTHTVTGITAASYSTIGSTIAGTHSVTEITNLTQWTTSTTESAFNFSTSGSYSEITTTTSYTASSVATESSFISVATVTLNSEVFTRMQSITETLFTAWPAPVSFGSLVNPATVGSFYPKAAGVIELNSWGEHGNQLSASPSVSITEIASGSRWPGLSDAVRISLSEGYTTMSSGFGRTTLEYSHGGSLSYTSSHVTTNTRTTGVVSFTLSAATANFTPKLSSTFSSVGGVPGGFSLVLPPGIYHFTKQIDGTSTTELTTWVQSHLSVHTETSVMGLGFPTRSESFRSVVFPHSETTVGSSLFVPTFTLTKYPLI